MTAVDVDALDALAAVLDDTATGLWMGQHGPGWGRVVANALLPVVDLIANERAAAELRAAAKWALLEAASHEGYAAKSMSRNSDLREAEARVFRAASNRLHACADALDPS